MSLSVTFQRIDPGPWQALLVDRFGFAPEVFAPFDFAQPNDKYIALIPSGFDPPASPDLVQYGMLLLKIKMRFPKLTTQAAMHFGHFATRNIVDLTPKQGQAYRAREPQRLSSEVATRCTGLGYVIVMQSGRPLGLGMFSPDDDGGWLQSMFPKHWAGMRY